MTFVKILVMIFVKIVIMAFYVINLPKNLTFAMISVCSYSIINFGHVENSSKAKL